MITAAVLDCCVFPKKVYIPTGPEITILKRSLDSIYEKRKEFISLMQTVKLDSFISKGHFIGFSTQVGCMALVTLRANDSMLIVGREPTTSPYEVEENRCFCLPSSNELFYYGDLRDGPYPYMADTMFRFEWKLNAHPYLRVSSFIYDTVKMRYVFAGYRTKPYWETKTWFNRTNWCFSILKKTFEVWNAK